MRQVQCGRIGNQQGSLTEELRREISRSTVRSLVRYESLRTTRSVANSKKLNEAMSVHEAVGNRSSSRLWAVSDEQLVAMLVDRARNDGCG